MKIVQGVSYRHVAAYLRVQGRTQKGAERHTKSIGTALRDRLPSGTEVKPGRYRGFSKGFHIYEVPVLLTHSKVRKVLTEMVIKGGP